MFVGLRAFKKEIKDFSERIPRGGIALTRRAGRDLFTDIVTRTPKDTKFTSSKWKHSINSRPTGGSIRNPRDGSSHTPSPTPLLTTFGPDDVLYIFNNVAWIRKLEDGWSKKAPRNFVKNAVARARYKLRQDFKKLK